MLITLWGYYYYYYYYSYYAPESTVVNDELFEGKDVIFSIEKICCQEVPRGVKC